MESLRQDVRFGLRVQRRSPGFTAIAVITLALGIGANTALFSVINGVLLNPLPFPEPDQLVGLHESKPNFDRGSISYPNFRDWQNQNRTFSKIAVSRPYSFSLTGMGDAEQISAQFISSDFFSTLGLTPQIGHDFAPGEDEIGVAPITLIGAGLRAIRSLLFGLSPTDPLTFSAVALLLIAVALLACWLPARRAARVDPMVALRYE